MSLSPFESWAYLPDDALLEAFAGVTPEALRFAAYDWALHGRPDQREPVGCGRVWLMMAGRGFGKTRAGAEWVRGIAETDGSARIALVGANLHEARSVMVEGESGVLAVSPWWDRPLWQPALRRLVWKSGAQAEIFGAGPEGMRGPAFSHAWADEIAKWPMGEAAWDNMEMPLRLGSAPRILATTTPRPVPLVRRLMAQAGSATGGGVTVTRGRTDDNRANLPPAFIDAMHGSYAGTRLGRQELDGELLMDVEGALWTRALIERCRVLHVPVADDGRNGGQPALARVVVGVDPPAGTDGDACGIVVAGVAPDGRGNVIADASVSGLGPEGWARAVAGAAAAHGADRVVAEANNGGAMVESVLRAVDVGLPVKLVHATRSKSARAEPVSALYESGRVWHRGAFPALEDEMCGMVIGGGYEGPGRSPDRADALVWVLTELMLGKRAATPRVWGV